MSIQRYGFTDVGRLDPIKDGRWCIAQEAVDQLAAKDAEIAKLRERDRLMVYATGELASKNAKLREALENIKARIATEGGNTVCWNIANKVLKETE